MSKIKPERAFAAEHFDTFDGYKGSPMQKNGHASSISNFRITADGSLKRRGGYSRYCTFPSDIRAFWNGFVGTKSYRFAVCGTTVYLLDDTTDEPISIGSVASESGEIRFFAYEGDLYLLDGNSISIFSLAAQSFSEISPYVPLYGNNWDPSKRGSVYEPFNLLSNHIRVIYENPGNATTFSLPFAIRQIVGVRVNGQEVTDYTAESYSSILTLPESSTGYYVEVAMEPVMSSRSTDIRTARRHALLTGQSQNALLLYGTDSGYNVYPTAPVSQYSLYACRVFYPSAKPLYFKEKDILQIGDSEHPLTSLCRFRDHLLAYCEHGTWAVHLNEDTEALSATPVLSGISCTAPNAAIVAQESPVLVNANGIFLLDVPRSASEEPLTERISEPVEEYMTQSFLENACAWENRPMGEIWFHDPTQPTSPVLVYHQQQKQWYLFDGIPATAFADIPSGAVFLAGDKVYLIDERLTTDDGAEISAHYQSGYFSFSHPEAQKRALRMVICAHTSSDRCHILLESEKRQLLFQLKGAGGDAPDYFDRRVLIGRFRFLRFQIIMGGESNDSIHSISFYANL